MHGSNLVLPKCVCNNYQRRCMQIDSMLLWVSSLMDHRPDVKMWLKKKVAYEAHLSVWCSYHILTSRLWSITEQTYGNMEPIGMHRRWCAQFSSKRLSSNTSSVKLHLKYCICIFLAAVLKQSRKYQQYCAIVTDLDVANDPRYLHGCVELWYASSSSTRAQVRFTMHFECQVTKEGISVSCKPSERQAKVC